MISLRSIGITIGDQLCNVQLKSGVGGDCYRVLLLLCAEKLDLGFDIDDGPAYPTHTMHIRYTSSQPFKRSKP